MVDPQKLPHLLKYMGSKRELLEFINHAINQLQTDSNWFCDLFSGTSTVGCSLRDEYNIHINDIQYYTSIFANTYLKNGDDNKNKIDFDLIREQVFHFKDEFISKYVELEFNYNELDYEAFKKLEEAQQGLINKEFKIGFHLFAKYYSGTYWSYEQCVWIDAIRAVAEKYKTKSDYYLILSSLIFAMSYSSQSTGHFAQYRDITKSNMNDILQYRTRSIWTLFEKKYKELSNFQQSNILANDYRITSLDYLDCLRLIDENTIVYADPPYSSVHYSRFYHAVETIVKYDYPNIKHKGRYREDRHQSPFGKKTEVKKAFKDLFDRIKDRKSHLILSYSNNGMITEKEITDIADKSFGNEYKSFIFSKKYLHSKMGRADEKFMEVDELIIAYKRL